MRFLLPKALVAVLLGLGVLAGLIRADEPPKRPLVTVVKFTDPALAAPLAAPLAPAAPPASGFFVPPTAPNLSFEGGPLPATPTRTESPFQQRLHRHPYYCWDHHNTLGCGSLHSELTFIFGSCRTFFGEPCFKGPPTPPYMYPAQTIPAGVYDDNPKHGRGFFGLFKSSCANCP